MLKLYFLELWSCGGAGTREQRRCPRRLLAGSAEQRPAAKPGAELRSSGSALIGWNPGDREGHMNMCGPTTASHNNPALMSCKYENTSFQSLLITLCRVTHADDLPYLNPL